MTDWPTVRLPKEMMDEVESFTKTAYAKKSGFTSKSQVMVSAVRDFLKHYSEFMKTIEIVDISDASVVLMDNTLGKKINVTIKNQKATCEIDKGQCIHVDYVWLLPKFHNVLKFS